MNSPSIEKPFEVLVETSKETVISVFAKINWRRNNNNNSSRTLFCNSLEIVRYWQVLNSILQLILFQLFKQNYNCRRSVCTNELNMLKRKFPVVSNVCHVYEFALLVAQRQLTFILTITTRHRTNGRYAGNTYSSLLSLCNIPCSLVFIGR